LFFILCIYILYFFFFFSSRRRHTRFSRDWSSDVCSSDLEAEEIVSFTGDLLNMDKNISINFLNKQQSGYALVFSDVLLTKISGSKPFGFRITNKNHLFFGETRLGLKKLFAYQEDKKIISRLEFIQ